MLAIMLALLAVLTIAMVIIAVARGREASAATAKADDAAREEVFEAHVRWGRAVMGDARPP